GDPEPLEQRRVHVHVGPPVERGQPILGNVARQEDAWIAEARLLPPTGAAGENEAVVAFEQPPGLDQPCEILARLERSDAKDERPVEGGALAVETKASPDAGAGHDEPLRLD